MVSRTVSMAPLWPSVDCRAADSGCYHRSCRPLSERARRGLSADGFQSSPLHWAGGSASRDNFSHRHRTRRVSETNQTVCLRSVTDRSTNCRSALRRAIRPPRQPRPISSHLIPSFPSHPISSFPTPSYFVPSFPIPSHPIPYHPRPSHPIPSRPVPSHSITSRPTPSHRLSPFLVLILSSKAPPGARHSRPILHDTVLT